MNIADGIIVFIVGISAVFGFYHGFIQTVANMAGSLLSLVAGFTLGPRLAEALAGNTTLMQTLATYTDAIARVGDRSLASVPVSSLSRSVVDTVLSSVALPKQLADILEHNLLTEALAGSGRVTVNDYVSGTIVGAALQVLCFIACVVAAYAALTLLVSLIRHVVRFPILRQLDWLAGGLFGTARGILLVALVFLLIPIALTVIPVKGLDDILSGSTLAGYFSGGGFFARVISGG